MDGDCAHRFVHMCSDIFLSKELSDGCVLDPINIRMRIYESYVYTEFVTHSLMCIQSSWLIVVRVCRVDLRLMYVWMRIYDTQVQAKEHCSGQQFCCPLKLPTTTIIKSFEYEFLSIELLFRFFVFGSFLIQKRYYKKNSNISSHKQFQYWSVWFLVVVTFFLQDQTITKTKTIAKTILTLIQEFVVTGRLFCFLNICDFFHVVSFLCFVW